MLLIPFVVVIVHQGCSGPEPAETYGLNSEGYCTLPPGVSGSPQTIEDVVTIINSLRKPVTVACFLSALDRPLKISATSNALSAQPASGFRSPRIFIMNGNLFISVVPEGEGAKVVEFSFLTAPDTSIKAELDFPVLNNLPPHAPYSKIRYQNGTSCATCHSNEQRVTSITFAEAFSSRAFQPKPETLVDVTYLKLESQSCNMSTEFERCHNLKALFDFGEVQSQAFPMGMPFAFSF